MAAPARAAEPERLSSFQPLTIQDAYPTRFGQVELEAAFRWDRTQGGNDLFEPRPRIKLGAFPGLQLSVGVPYRLGNAAGTDQGDVEVGALGTSSRMRAAPSSPRSPSRAGRCSRSARAQARRRPWRCSRPGR